MALLRCLVGHLASALPPLIVSVEARPEWHYYVPGLALRGPDGSMFKATTKMYYYLKIALRTFWTGIALALCSACCLWYSRLPPQSGGKDFCRRFAVVTPEPYYLAGLQCVNASVTCDV